MVWKFFFDLNKYFTPQLYVIFDKNFFLLQAVEKKLIF